MTHQEQMLKLAYLQGLAQACDESGMEKEAILAAIGKGIGWLGSKAMKLWRGGPAQSLMEGPAFNTLGKGLSGGVRGMSSYATGLASKPFEAVGGAMGRQLKRYAPKAHEWINPMFEGAGRQAGGFGLLSGGIGAATAEEGQRGEGFLKGFGAGAIGGLGWGVGGNLVSKTLPQAFKAIRGPNAWKPMERALARPKFFGSKGDTMGQRFGTMGAKTLMGVGGFAVPLALSSAITPSESEPQMPENNMRKGTFRASQGDFGASKGSW